MELTKLNDKVIKVANKIDKTLFETLSTAWVIYKENINDGGI